MTFRSCQRVPLHRFNNGPVRISEIDHLHSTESLGLTTEFHPVLSRLLEESSNIIRLEADMSGTRITRLVIFQYSSWKWDR